MAATSRSSYCLKSLIISSSLRKGKKGSRYSRREGRVTGERNVVLGGRKGKKRKEQREAISPCLGRKKGGRPTASLNRLSGGKGREGSTRGGTRHPPGKRGGRRKTETGSLAPDILSPRRDVWLEA